MTAPRDMHHHVALLRGVNVGHANRVAMGDLRSVVGTLGYRDVRTLLNSGNVVFSAFEEGPRRIAARLEEALPTRLAITSRVVVLSAGELRTVVAGNPLLEVAHDPSRLFVGLPREASDLAKVAALAEPDWGEEALAVGGRAFYAWCPGGATGSPLLVAVGKALGDSVTMRNWATVLGLRDLLATDVP